MDANSEGKRKKDRKEDDDERRREKKSKRARSRSRSPAERRERESQRKRRRSRTRSPERDVKRETEKERKEPQEHAEPPARKPKETDMLNTRTGGAYIPPARLRMMQAQITDKSSVAYQRLAWEALKKSIHGHINKVNIGNIGIIIKELLKENIVRGRGLLCRSVIQAQAASPTFTNVYAALVAAINSRFPNIGELLLKRLVIQFKRGFKRNDKPICISSASFIAHLVNQRVAHEILALELLTLLVETPTDDSVEVAISFLKECGQKLTEVSSKGVNAIFEMLRNILHEGQLDKRVQYMIEVMFQVWKDGFKDHPALIEELELVPEEEQFTHLLMLDDGTDPQDILNVFKFDDKYEENEQKYKTLSKEILGSDAESGEEDGSGESGSEESDEEDENGEGEQKNMTIIDNTETNLVALRRTIYLTINSSLDFEECAHKLMKMELKPGQEVELCHMFLDCCAEQRTYEKFYGLLAQRFCNLNRIYIGPFEEIFKDSYGTAHRLDTNRLRNVSKFFAHLLFTDSISWEVLECVKLNEEDTTSSSRIYIKILFQELAEYMGLKKLNDRLKDPTLQSAFSGVFPRDNPKNTRFSINFFTSIGLGGLTDELREHLKQMPKNVPPAEITVGSSSSSDSSSSSSSSSDSDTSTSDSESEKEKSKKEKDKKKTKKNKDKTPKTPEDDPDKDKNDRWGHDGFYDTYGKDAQRHENPKNQKDKDNFAIPRDIPRKRDQRNGDDRKRNEDDSRGREDERRGRDTKDRYEIGRDDNRRREERPDRLERRNEERNRDEKRPERSDRKYEERTEINKDEERPERSDRKYEERTERNKDEERRERDRDDYRRSRYESERDSGYESKSKRYDEDRDKIRKDDRKERERSDRREKDRDNDTREKSSREERYKNRDDEPRERSSREERNKNKDDEPRERSSREERNKNKDDEPRERSSREERNKNKDDESRERSSREERNKNKDDESRERSSREERNKNKDDESRERSSREERNKNKDDEPRERSSREERNKNKDDEPRERSNRDDRIKDKDDDRRERSTREERKQDRNDDRREKSSREDKNKDRDDNRDRKSKKKSRSEREKPKSSESDSSEEDSSRRKKGEKSSRRSDDDDGERKSKRKDKYKNKENDGWDIRGESVKRELGERFWNS